MLFALHAIDYGVLGLYLAVLVAVGIFFSRTQRSVYDYFLAGRSLGWFPVGLSVVATLLTAQRFLGIPGDAYYAGLKWLLLPIAVWLILPIMVWFILPLYQRLEMTSVYEYLEFRFGVATRLAGSLAFFLWRLLWIGGWLYVPCKVMALLTGRNVPEWLLIVVVGLVGTAYTYLGGIKAVMWTDVVQAITIVAALLLVVGGIWWNLEGGSTAVWQVSEEFEPARTVVADLSFNLAEFWSFWSVLPFFAFTMLAFCVADQIAVQRFLTARDLQEAQRSFLFSCLAVSIVVSALAYVGLGLLAFYQQHPDQMRPVWVVNVDNVSRRSLTFADRERYAAVGPQYDTAAADADRPLVHWETDLADPDVLEELVAERRILRPNNKQPLTDVEELRDPNTGRLQVELLAVREAKHGEVILHRRAQNELLPHLVSTKLTVGAAGLVLAALFATAMSSLDSGLNSVATLLIVEIHRRFGVGRSYLARRLGKTVEQLDQGDELRLGRPLVLAAGVGATCCSLLASQIGSAVEVVIELTGSVGGPLLAVFLLGIFTRRATAAGSLAALLLGTLFTAWLTFGYDLASGITHLAWVWPFGELAGTWPLTIGTLATIVVGYVLSLVFGGRKPRNELRGLVVGVGELGQRQLDTASIAIPDLDIDEGEDARWRSSGITE